jgi:hypothetical protein
MEFEDLNYTEKGLIEILRAFRFLHQESYHEKEISIAGRSNPSVIYYSSKVNRIVKILGDESQSWTIVIQRRKIFDFKRDDSFFDISDYYKTFGGSMLKGRNYTLKSQVDFIKQHLMPVIKGEIWIDKLIKQKK